MTAEALPGTVESLYANHHGWLRRWLRRQLGSSHDAADLTHDTFVRIMASRDALLGLREPRAYLTATARNLLIDRSRRRVLEQAYLDGLMRSAAAEAVYPSPDALLMAVQALEQIGAALDGLLPRIREAFLRHYLEDQTQSAIAAELGVSKRMVQHYLVQALLHCRQRCPSLSEHGA